MEALEECCFIYDVEVSPKLGIVFWGRCLSTQVACIVTYVGMMVVITKAPEIQTGKMQGFDAIGFSRLNPPPEK